MTAGQPGGGDEFGPGGNGCLKASLARARCDHEAKKKADGPVAFFRSRVATQPCHEAVGCTHYVQQASSYMT